MRRREVFARSETWPAYVLSPERVFKHLPQSGLSDPQARRELRILVAPQHERTHPVVAAQSGGSVGMPVEYNLDNLIEHFDGSSGKITAQAWRRVSNLTSVSTRGSNHSCMHMP